MRKYIQLFFLFFLSFSIHAEDDLDMTIEKALDMSIDQQILSQKAAKVYLALCNNLREPKFYQDRDATIEKFDDQLRQLSLFIPDDNIKAQVQNVRKIWKEYKEIIGWSIKKDAASKILKQSTAILNASKLLHEAYKDYRSSQLKARESSDDISIRQYRKQNFNQLILIQRIMLYYLAEKEGIDPTASGHRLDEAQSAFSKILSVLEDSKITSKAIQSKLKLVRSSWSGISKHLVFVNKDQSYVADMHNQSEIISTAIYEILDLYKELGTKLSVSYAINETTAQSMHLQKIAKAYIASLHGNVGFKYKNDVFEHLDDFEKKMDEMLITAKSEDIRDATKVVKIMWKNYKKLVSNFEGVDELQAIKVLEQCHVVMAACDKVAIEVENYAQQIPAYKEFSFKDGAKVDPSLDITYQIHNASDLRLYSQRVAVYFMMAAMDLDKRISADRLNSTVSKFNEKFKELKESRLNSVAMTKLLESCSNEWDWLTQACKTKNADDIEAMLEHSDLLSRKLMKLTNLYEHKMNDLFAEDLKEESPAASKKN